MAYDLVAIEDTFSKWRFHEDWFLFPWGYHVDSNLSDNYKSNWEEKKANVFCSLKEKKRERKKQKEEDGEDMEGVRLHAWAPHQEPEPGSDFSPTQISGSLGSEAPIYSSSTKRYSIQGHFDAPVHAQSYDLHPCLILDKQLWTLKNYSPLAFGHTRAS